MDAVNFDAVANSIATVFCFKNYERIASDALKKFEANGRLGDPNVFIVRELQEHFAVAYETAFTDAIRDSELYPSLPESDGTEG